MRLYDTFQDSIVDFAPSNEVRMYVCGITPYDATHLGHANTYLAYDLLIRRLQDLGHNVDMVCNITDVDDSILPKARELGVDFAELAATETARFHDDMRALCRLPPRAEPKATEWVAQMIEMITKLADAGHVYGVDGTYWFDVATWPEFGSLSKLDQQTMVELAAERGGNPDDPRQRNPLDFVLWQPSLPDEPKWDSPFGVGRPGWHIECSAMSMGLLGDEIDLHGGGTDLIFPHHECEIAQSEAATGNRFVKHWMHCGMVVYQGEKMSKSLGNLVFVNDLTAKFDPAALRLALMGHHYREDWEWYDNHINEGVTLLGILNEAASRDSTLPPRGTTERSIPDPRPFARKVRAALDDDLDSPRARNVLIELAQAILAADDYAGSAPAVLRELCELCGIQLKQAPTQDRTTP
ncbi:MAG: cysteine--tRNA ligase [Acidimicrobiaceae bacterium]|nr:cysteine--tRNA ligase [Acidimicrobiaceae bacterium]